MNTLKISTTDCHFGLGCRNSHREPNKANKSELQKIIGNKSHHGSAKVKLGIHNALNLLWCVEEQNDIVGIYESDKPLKRKHPDLVLEKKGDHFPEDNKRPMKW